MTCPQTTDIGAYVLGSLSPAERRAVDEHLVDCPACAAELAELAGLPDLLALVDPAEIVPVVPTPDLYQRLAAEALAEAEPAAPQRHRSRRLRLVSAAAGLVLLAAAGAGIGVATSQHHGPASFSASGPGAVHIRVTAMAENTGTALDVAVSGLPEDEHCHLVAIARDGTRHAAGDWVATYSGKAEVTGSTTVARADLQRLVLYGTQGQQLVTVTT